MQVRKYRAPTMKEALAKVKAELGPDAVILNSRSVGGIFGRGEIELTVVDDRGEVAVSPRATQPAVRPDVAMRAEPLMSSGALHRTESPQREAEQTIQISEREFKTQLRPLWDEIRALRGQLHQSQSEPVRHELSEMKRYLGQLLSVRPNDGLTERMLHAADVDPDLIAVLTDETRARLGAAASLGALSPDQERAALAEAIRLRIRKFEPARGPRVMMLVGPTGVGKTTTVAKLAAHASLVEGKRVGVITHDTFRVGAVEQLRRYAELMRVPMRVAADRESFLRALEQFRGADLVLVDTAGRRPNDERAVSAIQRLILGTPVEPHLVVPATGRSIELRTIVERYKPLRPKSVIFTKLDEASVFGAVVNVTMRGDLAVSHTTHGQRVPEDIESANPRELALRVINPVFDALSYSADYAAAS